jgi:hypothetical protein
MQVINWVDNCFDGLVWLRDVLTGDRARRCYAVAAISVVIAIWLLWVGGRQLIKLANKAVRHGWVTAKVEYQLWVYRRKLQRIIAQPLLAAKVEPAVVEIAVPNKPNKRPAKRRAGRQCVAAG